MDELQTAVSLALRDTETCAATVEVWDESQISTAQEPKDQRRILAVVIHGYTNKILGTISTIDDAGGPDTAEEQGCLFVMKYKSPSSSELHPHLLFPIGPGFTASLQQANSGTSSFNASEFKLTLKYFKKSITLGSVQADALSTILEECRRLKKLVDPDSVLDSPTTLIAGSDIPEKSAATESAETELPQVESPNDVEERFWEWLHFYLSNKDHRILPSQKAKPGDIRSTLHGPKLLESSAGLLENENEDISLIRDHWVHREFKRLKNQYSQTEQIRLRIGTFNVNSKPPSQSLRSWLRPSTAHDTQTLSAGDPLNHSGTTPTAESPPDDEKSLSAEVSAETSSNVPATESLEDTKSRGREIQTELSSNPTTENISKDENGVNAVSEYENDVITKTQVESSADDPVTDSVSQDMESLDAQVPAESDSAVPAKESLPEDADSRDPETSVEPSRDSTAKESLLEDSKSRDMEAQTELSSNTATDGISEEPTGGTTKIPVEHPSIDSLSVTESTIHSSITLAPTEDTAATSLPPETDIFEDNEDLPDMFVLGFQELDLSAEALLYRTSTLKVDAWITAIYDALGKAANGYIQLVSKQLVGVLVIVLIRKEMLPIVKEVSTSAGGVGILGIMGNKGATAVRLQLNSTIVTFVCSHLAASDDYAEKRNSDFAEICRKLQFPTTWKGARNMVPVTANVWETDMLFWLGDLNYRIDLPDHEVRSLLAQGDEYDTLLPYDQLKHAVRHKRAFTGFVEHPITFLPTYRFSDTPTDDLGYDLKRRPAWTDRILHIAADPDSVSQLSYQSHPMITLSDHRPISAEFNLRLETHDPHELHRIAMSIFEKLGEFEMSEAEPQVTLLDGTDIDLGQVSYPAAISRTIRVKNERDEACAFRFVPLEPGSPISSEWLKVEPICGLLLPQATETIKLSINIDKRTASFLNHGHTKLEDSIILHLGKGTDHMINVSGSYLPTCFANSLAWLVRSPGPIRGDTNQLLPETNTLSAPRELMFLVEWLITNAQDVDDLFLTPGDESLVDLIRIHLDTQRLDLGKEIEFPEGTEHKAIALAFADAMLQFLDSLIEPVIPWVLHPQCALATEREDAFEVLDHVPGFARNVYVTVTAFLHFIGQKGGPDRPPKLAKIFADILLRDNPRAPPGIPEVTPLGKRRFLLLTIS